MKTCLENPWQKRALKNGKTKFLYRQNRYLSNPLKRMFCNSLILPHFDFACCTRYPNLPMSLKNKFQTAQNTYIRFYVRMERRCHIRLNRFEKTYWLLVKNRVNQCIAAMTYNFKNNLSCLCLIYIL